MAPVVPVDDWQEVQSLALTGALGLGATPSAPRVDPYLLWAQATDFIDVGGAAGTPPGDAWYSVLIEVAATYGTAATFAQAVASLGVWIRIPAAYASPAPGIAASRFCSARVTEEFFKQLGTHPVLVRAIERVILGAPVVTVPPAAAGNKPMQVPLSSTKGFSPPRETFVAVVDDRFAFAHRRLTRGGQTRLVAYWNQEDRAAPTQGFGYGIELSGSNIDTLLAGFRTLDGRIDEDAVYRAAGLMPEVDRRASHGSHVLDFASGAEPAATDVMPRLICVDLPRRVTEDTSGRALPVLVLDALRYVLDRADAAVAVGAPLPHVIVNLSYGMIAGPHDGSSLLERAIDELVDLREAQGARFDVVIPSGNFRLSRCHADFAVKEIDAAQPLRWRVLPDDGTASFVEIWLQHAEAAKGVRVRVTSPHGQASPWVGIGEMATLHAATGALPICTVVYARHDTLGALPMILVATAPTAAHGRARPVAAAGNWTIAFDTATPLQAKAWVQRDDFVFGYRQRGRQSRFDDPGRYRLFDQQGRLEVKNNTKSVIRQFDTLNAIASGKRVHVVGGERFVGNLNAPTRADARYSSVDMNGAVPLREIAEDSDTSFGRLAAGMRSGCVMAMNGTSVAAPQFTRRLADWLIQNPDATGLPPAGAPVQATRVRRDA